MKKGFVIKQVIALAFLAVIFIALTLIKGSVAASEWLAINVSRRWVELFGRIFSLLPFSVYELTLYALVISAVAITVTIIKRLIKKNYLPALSMVLAVCLTVFTFLNIYTLSAGFSYYRDGVELPGATYELTDEEVARLSPIFMEEFNSLSAKMKRDKSGNVVCPYSFQKLERLIRKEFKRLDGDYLSDYTPKAKKVLSSRIMSEMHVTGVFFAPYGEVNINAMIPDVDLPVTVAHEIAHAKGVMREDEANMVAYYLTCSSEDEYLRYCGYAAVFYRVFSAVHFDGELKQNLYSGLDESIYLDLANAADFWSKYKLLSTITDFFNNIYLKLQGVKEGTGSYDDNDIIVDVPVDDGTGNIIIETRYYYTDLQKMIYSLIMDRENG